MASREAAMAFPRRSGHGPRLRPHAGYPPGPQSSAVAFLAYMKRARLVDEVTGQAYDFTERHEGGEACWRSGVELPEGAPEAWRDPARLVNDMQRAELVRDRKTGEVRYRSGAQLARAETLAMPRELGIEEWKAMVTAYVHDICLEGRPGRLGYPRCQRGPAARPSPGLDTRLRSGDRHAQPPQGARAESGLRQGRPGPGRPGASLGRLSGAVGTFPRARAEVRRAGTGRAEAPGGRDTSVDGPSDAMDQADEAEEANREALRDPAKVLATLSAQKSTWTERDLSRLLRALPLQERGEIKSLVLGQDQVLKLDEGRLYDTVGGGAGATPRGSCRKGGSGRNGMRPPPRRSRPCWPPRRRFLRSSGRPFSIARELGSWSWSGAEPAPARAIR